MLNSMGATMAGVGTVPKLLAGMRITSTIKVMPPPGQTYAGAPPQVTFTKACFTARVSWIGLSVTPERKLPPAPPKNKTDTNEGSQLSPMRSTTCRTSLGMAAA
jgi:hypothetical protein